MMNRFFPSRVLLVPVATWLIMAGVVSAQTVRVFEPGMEGEVWERVHRIGEPIPPDCLSPKERESLEAPTCPAAPNQLYFPNQVALWENGGDYRFYVTDLGNHRVVAFDRSGAPLPFATPIGSGEPGGGPQDLNFPEGIAVDAGGRIVVADAANNRIQVFNQDGRRQFAVTVGGLWHPTGLAVRPGVSLIDPASAEAAPAGAAVAVLNGYSSELFVLDAKFQILAVIGSYGDQPGELGYATGVAFDAAGRIAVADYENSRVQVFGSDLAPMPILVFGELGSDPGNLLYPYSLTVDRRGRIVISDTDNQRLSVFLPDYSVTPATAALQFDLNADGGLNGYPRGVVEDSSGRLIIVDTTNDEVEIFQVPDLAVFDVSIAPPDPLRVGDTVTLSFSVIVPALHPAVTDVMPVVASAGPLTQTSADPAPTPRLAGDEPGTPQVVSYEYTFRAEATGGENPVPVTFTVGATGNPGGMTVAPSRSVATTTVACAGCEEAAPMVSSELVDDAGVPLPVPASGWFNHAVTIRLTAIDQGENGHGAPRPAGGMGRIVFQIPFGPELVNYPKAESIDGPTAGIDPLTGDVRLTLDSPGSVLEFWADDIFGNRSAIQSRTVKIDTVPPNVMFEFPAANANGWWRVAPLVVNVRTVDGLSGVGPHAPLAFAQEGVNSAQAISVTDAAGNTTTVDSDNDVYGGRVVRLDTVSPVVTATPATAPNAAGWYNGPVSVAFAAVDATSGVEPGSVSAPVTIGTEGNAVPIAGSARDLAGNIGVGSATVKIDRTPPTTSADRAPGNYVGPLALNLTAIDQAGLSGVAQTFFSLEGAHNAAPQAVSGPIPLTIAGDTDVTFWSVDAAGNQEAPRTLPFTVAPPAAPAEACLIVDFREITYFQSSKVITSSDAGIRARNGIAGGFNPALWPYSTRASSSMTRSRGTLFRIYGFYASELGQAVRNADNPALTYVVRLDPDISGAYYIDLGGPARVTICPSQLETRLVDRDRHAGSLPGSTPIGAGLLNVPGILLTRNAQAIALPERVRRELANLGTPVATTLAQVDYVSVQLQGLGNAKFREFVNVEISFANDSPTDRLKHYTFGFHTAANAGFESFAGCNYIDHAPGNDSVRLNDVWGRSRGSNKSAGACGSRELHVNQKVRANDAVPYNAVQFLTTVNMASDTVRLFYGEIRPFVR